MSSLEEFKFFPLLPKELRLKIWEYASPPTRLIGQLPCSRCWKSTQHHGSRSSAKITCDEQHEQLDKTFRWVANRRDEKIFSPLQACKESRDVWLPQYRSMMQDLDLTQNDVQDSDLGAAVTYSSRFEMPYINYETDIFTIYDAGPSLSGSNSDPFPGLDRNQIRRIAVSENAWHMVEAIAAIKPQKLPLLQSVSIIVSGPNPAVDESDASPWREMHSIDIQNFNNVIHPISEEVMTQHPLFSTSRLRHLVYEPEPALRLLRNYKKLFAAWWWHAMRWDEGAFREPSEVPWWRFSDYVFEEDESVCPLEQAWCEGSHTREKILGQDGGGVVVEVLLLVEERCMVVLSESLALEIDLGGAYDSFFRFMEGRTMDGITA